MVKVKVFDVLYMFLCVVCSSVNVQQRAAETKTFSFTVVGVCELECVFFWGFFELLKGRSPECCNFLRSISPLRFSCIRTSCVYVCMDTPDWVVLHLLTETSAFLEMQDVCLLTAAERLQY